MKWLLANQTEELLGILKSLLKLPRLFQIPELLILLFRTADAILKAVLQIKAGAFTITLNCKGLRRVE